MAVSQEFKDQIVNELIKTHNEFEGSEYDFVRRYGTLAVDLIVETKLGEEKTKPKVTTAEWVKFCQILKLDPSQRKWNVAKTEVFMTIEADIMFCKEHAKSRIFVDDCAIGKTFTAKYLSKTLENCFYIDASQAITKVQFIRYLAFCLGLDYKGSFQNVIESIKICITSMDFPIIIIDEAGDLRYSAFLSIKELWNATENKCGWYLMGADGLRSVIEKGINQQKVGYAEIFSRFSNNYSSIVPTDRKEKREFYKKLIGDVLDANMEDKSQIPGIIRKCLVNGENVGGLRRAESLIILNRA